MLQFDEYKVKLNNLLPQLDELEKALNLESAAREVDFLEAQSASDGFWDNPENSQRVLQKLKQLKNKLESQEKRRASWEDMMVLCEMGNEEEDESLLPELEEEYNALIQSVESAKLQTLLTGEYDASNAILAFHAGAGGTEAQDWAQMLYRMYTRWAERHGFSYKVMDYQEGDEAGLKSATIMIEGENAYGYLRGERRCITWSRVPATPMPVILFRLRGGDARSAGGCGVEIRQETLKYRSPSASTGGQRQ